MSQVKGRVLSDSVHVYTARENHERLIAELRALGATAEDLAPLDEAIKAIEAEEAEEDRQEHRNPVLRNEDLGDITAPRELPNGWVIAPPSRPAKRWAMLAVMKVTGGAPPADLMSQTMSLWAGLWVLWQWGQGARDQVMQTVSGAGRLAELVAELDEAFAGYTPEQVAGDYVALMGFRKEDPAQKKTLAIRNHEAVATAIRVRLSAGGIRPASNNGSAPAPDSV